MKLWLMDILACPIDKAFPLELTVLKWVNENIEANKDAKFDEINKLIGKFNARNVLPPKSETPLKTELKPDRKFYVHDTLILKPTEFSKYLKETLERIDELKYVVDKSGWDGQKAINLISNQIKEKLNLTLKILEDESEKIINFNEEFKKIIPELEFINFFKYNYEIEDALIKCPKCNRWYPVFETIPQMLPDSVRDQKNDENFQEKWKSKVEF